MEKINQTVLMSGVDYFTVEELNPYSSVLNQPNSAKAQAEYAQLQNAFRSAGIAISQVQSPQGCQDGVYTANWALCRGDTAVMSALPNMRTAETPHAEKALKALGKTIIYPPPGLRFSGQGDALPCGNYLFAGSGYRSDQKVHDFLAKTLGYKVISLQTIPAVNSGGQPIINKVTGWADSFFYDIDLAISVISPQLLAWCPKAFTPASQQVMQNVPIEKIEVSLKEAQTGFACNLVSTGETVVMSANAPVLKAALIAKGLRVITPAMQELPKGGGYIRCTTLTLTNT